MNTLNLLSHLPRPTRVVALPGGGEVSVRALTLAELRRIDGRAAAVADPVDRTVRTTLLIAAYGLVAAGDPTDDAVELVAEHLTAEQLREVCRAAVGGDKDQAKN